MWVGVQKSYKIIIHVIVSGRTDEYRPLHKSYKTPERLRFTFNFAQDWRQKVTHSLRVSGMKGLT